MKQSKQPPSRERIHLRRRENEMDFFREEEEKHDKHISPVVMLAVALFFLFWLSLVLAIPYRQWIFSPAWIFESVRSRFKHLYEFLFGISPVFGITFYQYIAVMLAGASLAACGAVFQGSFRNVLAGPSTMGVTSGGSLGCMLYLLCFTSSNTLVEYVTADASAAPLPFWMMYQQQFFTLLGCFAGVFLVMGVATVAGRGRLSASAMILSGTVFTSLIGNVSMLIRYYIMMKDPDDTRLQALQNLMMGSFNNMTTWQSVAMMGVPILLCLAVLFLVSGRLNLLALGEEEASAMGVSVRFYRYLMVAVGTVLTAVVVAFCGQIGFLGFMIPMIGRKLAGPDMRRLLPVSVLMGAILLTLVFDAAYIAGMTDYLNLFTSTIGTIVMIITLLKRKGRKGESGNAAFQGAGPRGMGMR